MNIKSEFSGDNVKATDLTVNEPLPLTIKKVTKEEMPKTHDEKVVVLFDQMSQRLILNKTNGNTLVQGYGRETDKWIGRPVVLYRTTTTFRGKAVPAIRIDIPASDSQGGKVPF